VLEAKSSAKKWRSLSRPDPDHVLHSPPRLRIGPLGIPETLGKGVYAHNLEESRAQTGDGAAQKTLELTEQLI
jgi:hypothetical protein